MKMSKLFEEKIVVVTGAAGTLCREISLFFAKEGAKVALLGRTEEALETVVREILSAGGTAEVFPCDVTDEAKMEAVANKIKLLWGGADILINGAGGNQPGAMTQNIAYTEEELSENDTDKPCGFFSMDMDVFHSVLSVNTIGTVIACRVFGKQMAKKQKGVIINFASMNAYCPLTRVPAYAMSKAGIANFTQWLAAYLAPAGIRVNAIAPGFFLNNRSRNFLGTVEDGLTPRGAQVINHTPQGRFGEASDLLGTVQWLSDDSASAFVTGITVPVDGGFLCRSGV